MFDIRQIRNNNNNNTHVIISHRRLLRYYIITLHSAHATHKLCIMYTIFGHLSFSNVHFLVA